MNNKLILVVVVAILILGGLLLFKNRGMAPTEVEVGNNMPVVGSDTKEMEVIREFSVDTTSFSFSSKTMTVNKGDTVRITMKNISGNHDLKIDEFNVFTRVLKAGETEAITFVADKTGTFEYYCSVDNHRAMGMVGTLTVI